MRTSIRFIRIEVMRPAMLLRKLGLPQATIWRNMRLLKRGRVNRSSIFPRAKGIKAMIAQIAMPRAEPSAAPQIPQ